MQDFEQKNARGGGMRKISRGWPWFDKIDKASTRDCLAAISLGPFI